MTHLLDTDLCVAHLRARNPVITNRLLAAKRADLAVCSIVRAELMAGAHHKRAPQDELQRLLDFLSMFSSPPFDDAAADHYGRARAQLEATGGPIGSSDLLIASIALANGLTLVTHNVSEYSRVPDLRIEVWGHT